MKQMKLAVTFAAILSASVSAHASSVCKGQAASGKIVTVSIDTYRYPDRLASAAVAIRDANGNLLNSYAIPVAQIGEYFDGCRAGGGEDSDCTEVSVGLNVALGDNFVLINYVGKPYGGNLDQVLADPHRAAQPNNSMRVWKGDPTAAPGNDYYSFKDVVCSVDTGI